MIDKQNISPSFTIERRDQGDVSPGQAVICVGGVLIEEIPIGGFNTVKTLVIDLPPFTLLGEERDRVAVDAITVESIKKLIDQITDADDTEFINSLAPVISTLQNRSTHHEKKDNLLLCLQNRVREILPEDRFYIPNEAGFSRLRLENARMLDPMIHSSDWSKIPGLSIPSLEGQGYQIYTAPMEANPDSPCIIWNDRIILDQSIFERFKEDPTILNLYLDALAQSQGTQIKRIVKKSGNGSLKNELRSSDLGQGEKARQAAERKEYIPSPLENFIVDNYNNLGFPNADTAELEARKFIRKNDELSKTYEDIVLKLPNSLALSLMDLALSGFYGSLDIQTLKAVDSLTQSPALLAQMEKRGSRLLFETDDNQYPSPYVFKPFGGGVDVKTLSNQGEWFEKNYWDRDNVLYKDGKVYQGHPTNHPESTFGYILLRLDDRIQFLDPETGEIYKHSFPFFPKDSNKGYHCFEFGGRRMVGIEQTPREGWAKKSPMLVFDFETGEPADIYSDEGDIISVQDSSTYQTPETYIFVRRIVDDQPTYYKISSDGRQEVYDGGEYFSTPEIFQINSDINGVNFEANGKTIYRAEYSPAIKEYYNDSLDGSKMVTRRLYHVIDGGYATRGSHEKTISAGRRFVNSETIETGQGQFLLVQNIMPIDPGEQNQRDEQSSDIIAKSDSVIIDQEGNVIIQLKDNEFCGEIVGADRKKNGDPLFLILEFDQIRFDEHLTPRLEYATGYHYLNIHGKQPSESEIENVHHNRDTRLGAFPAEIGENWRIKFQGNGHRARIVSSSTGEEIISEDIRHITFDSNLGLWRCELVAPSKRTYQATDTYSAGRKVDKAFKRELLIDSAGQIIDEKLLGERESVNLKGEILRDPIELSAEQCQVMAEIIENSGDVPSPSVERFVALCQKFGHLSPESIRAVAPAFLRVKYISPDLITDEVIQRIESVIESYDDETKSDCYKFLFNLLPNNVSDEEREIIVVKALRLFKSKLADMPAGERNLTIVQFDWLKDFNKEYLARGWEIARYGSPVPSQQLHETIRPLVDFIRTEEAEQLANAPDIIEFADGTSLTLSQLIQTKRLNERNMQQFSGSAAELRDFVDQSTAGKDQDHIKREIVHPIYYQNVDSPYLFVRELIQNAHDAVIKNGGENENVVNVDLFSRGSGEVSMRVQDSVGMSFQDVINYFLIPGETTKKGDDQTIGYFGQGLFTLFRGAKEVVLQTGKGDGTITKLRISPIFDDSGMISDLGLNIEQEEGDFKGTIVEKTVPSDEPTIEAAFMKNATCTYSSLVDPNVVRIRLGEQEVNKPLRILASSEIPGIGRLSIYNAPNNVITQRGLYVKPVDSDYTTGLSDVEKLLESKGYVLDIPASIDLTRSRNDIARKQEVLPQIQEYLSVLKVQAYISILQQDISEGGKILLENLPSDYFYYDYRPKDSVVVDAERVKNGEPLPNINEYIDRNKMIELLVLLPAVELDDKTWSLLELKDAAATGSAPLHSKENYDKLPYAIRKRLEEVKKRPERTSFNVAEIIEAIGGKRPSDFKLEDIESQSDEIRAIVAQRMEQYVRMRDLSQRLNELVARSANLGHAPDTTFYAEHDQSKAHAPQGTVSYIGWNLHYWNTDEELRPFETAESTDAQLEEFLDTHSHEFTHLLERRGEMTHNQSFYGSQARVLSLLMHGLRQRDDVRNASDLVRGTAAS